MKKSIPAYCKDCGFLWTHGIKDNKHNMWCCALGRPTWKAVEHCKLHNLKKVEDKGY